MSTSSHRYSLKEVLQMILRENNIREGHWVLNVDFTATGASAQISGTQPAVVPSLVVSVTGIGITRVIEPDANTIDAAEAVPALSPRGVRASNRTKRDEPIH